MDCFGLNDPAPAAQAQRAAGGLVVLEDVVNQLANLQIEDIDFDDAASTEPKGKQVEEEDMCEEADTGKFEFSTQITPPLATFGGLAYNGQPFTFNTPPRPSTPVESVAFTFNAEYTPVTFKAVDVPPMTVTTAMFEPPRPESPMQVDPPKIETDNEPRPSTPELDHVRRVNEPVLPKRKDDYSHRRPRFGHPDYKAGTYNMYWNDGYWTTVTYGSQYETDMEGYLKSRRISELEYERKFPDSVAACQEARKRRAAEEEHAERFAQSSKPKEAAKPVTWTKEELEHRFGAKHAAREDVQRAAGLIERKTDRDASPVKYKAPSARSVSPAPSTVVEPEKPKRPPHSHPKSAGERFTVEGDMWRRIIQQANEAGIAIVDIGGGSGGFDRAMRRLKQNDFDRVVSYHACCPNVIDRDDERWAKLRANAKEKAAGVGHLIKNTDEAVSLCLWSGKFMSACRHKASDCSCYKNTGKDVPTYVVSTHSAYYFTVWDWDALPAVTYHVLHDFNGAGGFLPGNRGEDHPDVLEGKARPNKELSWRRGDNGFIICELLKPNTQEIGERYEHPDITPMLKNGWKTSRGQYKATTEDRVGSTLLYKVECKQRDGWEHEHKLRQMLRDEGVQPTQPFRGSPSSAGSAEEESESSGGYDAAQETPSSSGVDPVKHAPTPTTTKSEQTKPTAAPTKPAPQAVPLSKLSQMRFFLARKMMLPALNSTTTSLHSVGATAIASASRCFDTGVVDVAEIIDEASGDAVVAHTKLVQAIRKHQLDRGCLWAALGLEPRRKWLKLAANLILAFLFWRSCPVVRYLGNFFVWWGCKHPAQQVLFEAAWNTIGPDQMFTRYAPRFFVWLKFGLKWSTLYWLACAGECAYTTYNYHELQLMARWKLLNITKQ
jgi:hypothetical protein